MARKPLLEEVDDDEIDNMDMDLAQFDPSLRTPLAPVNKPVITRLQDSEPLLFDALGSAPQMAASLQDAKTNDLVNPDKLTDEEKREIGRLQIIYPCYFDRCRSHSQGRRVSVEQAVENPLAKTILDACRALKLPVLLELDKSHPQDFGNPGRVRVQLKAEDKTLAAPFANKRALFKEISAYLKEHPTTLESVGQASGIPLMKEYQSGFEPLVLPKVKGFHMNTIVPVHLRLTVKHPMTKSIYEKLPEVEEAPKPKAPKKKMMKIRG